MGSSVHRAASLILMLLLTASCAAMVPRQKALESLAGSAPCCDSLQELHYEQLPFDETVTFALDERSPSYNFPSGKSYVKAFTLPDHDPPYAVHVESFALGETVDKAHVFYPQLALLDASYSFVKMSDPGKFSLVKAGFFETASATWGLMVKMDGSMVVDKPEARYLLVYTTDELLKAATPYRVWRTMPIILPGGIVGVVPTNRETVEVPHSPFGRLTIEAVEE